MRTISRDEEAVSPVIGVILMVAITVILAAVIAAFVFGLTPPTAVPQTQLNAKVTNGTADTVVIQHKGGEPLLRSDLKLIAVNSTTSTQIASNTSAFGTGTLSVGDTVSVNANATFGAANQDLGSVGGQVIIQVVHIPTNSFLLDTRVTITS